MITPLILISWLYCFKSFAQFPNFNHSFQSHLEILDVLPQDHFSLKEQSFLNLTKNRKISSWEIGIVFLKDINDPLLTQAIEENIQELKNISNQPQNSIKINYWVYNYYQSLPEVQIKSMANHIKNELTSFYLKKPKKLETSLLNPTDMPRTLLIIYGHGLGPHGIGPFKLDQIKLILPKVDLLWFDSCFMANVETLYELRRYYHYALASQDSEISSGIPYHQLNQLNSTNSVEQAAFQLAESFLFSYSKKLKGSQSHHVIQSATTISVIDTESWKYFKRYFKHDWQKTLPELIRKDIKTFENSTKQLTMDDPRFLDLGSVAKLWELKELYEILDLIEIKKVRSKFSDEDFIFSKSKESDNPVKYFGYTKKITGRTRTYSGLNVYHPLKKGHFFNYYKLEINK